MDDYSAQDLQDALRPIASLISKSEKALTKLSPGTWQHTMLQENLRALRIATALMNGESLGSADVSEHDLAEALRAIDSMIGRTEGALAKFSPGTSQHTLQTNRLKALRVAEEMVRADLTKGE